MRYLALAVPLCKQFENGGLCGCECGGYVLYCLALFGCGFVRIGFGGVSFIGAQYLIDTAVYIYDLAVYIFKIDMGGALVNSYCPHTIQVVV